MDRDVLTEKQAAELLGSSAEAMRSYIRRHKVRCTKFMGRRLIDGVDLRRAMDKQSVTGEKIRSQVSKRMRHRIANGCGVYFLFDGDEVVYIGQSRRSVSSRVAFGSKNGVPFDSFLVIPVPEEELNSYERAAINEFQPRFNKALVGHP